jgi:hypothetical protein
VRCVLVGFCGSPIAFRAGDHVISLSRTGHRADVLLLIVQLVPENAAAAWRPTSDPRAGRQERSF